MVSILFLILLSVPISAGFWEDRPPEIYLSPLADERQVVLADESDKPDSGNWYLKLKWWKEAKWAYTEDVKAAMENLHHSEEGWNERKQEILANIDSYSASLPVQRQIAEKEIDELIEDMIRRQNEMAKGEGQPTAEIQSDELEEQKKMLSELKEKFLQFNTLAERIQQAFEQIIPMLIANAEMYDQRALYAYQSIDKTLDDKKAEELFNEVENSLENIKALTNYLKGPLSAFIDRAWAKVQQIMPQIETEIKDLEAKGVVVRPLTSEEKGQMAAIEQQRKELQAKKSAEAEAARKKAARPWYQKLFDAIGSFFSSLWYYLSWPFVWLSNQFTKKPVKKLDDNPANNAPVKNDQQAESKQVSA